MRNRAICLILSAALVVTPFGDVAAAPVSENSVVITEENEVSENDISAEEVSDSDGGYIPPAGYVPLNDGFVPEKVTMEAADLEAEKGLSGQGISALGDENATRYVPVGESFIPGTYENQGSTNLCWAFSQATACEINAKKNGLIDTDESLSATHLGFFFNNLGADVADPNGNTVNEYTRTTLGASENWTKGPGNGRMSMWESAGWMGMVPYFKDSDSVYDPVRISDPATDVDSLLLNDTSTAYLQDAVHVQGVYLSGLDDTKRLDTKRLIYNLGAVTAAYYAATDYDSFAQGKDDADGDVSYGNYYYDGTGSYTANHAITLIGWDDAYSKDNFVNTPSSDGAWLCLNSWGAEDKVLAQNGLFWLSYEDAGLLNENVAIGYSVESAEKYDYIYQYDGSCNITGVQAKRFIQFFDINSTEKIKAVSIGVYDANTTCDVSLYKINGSITDEMYTDVSWVDNNLLTGAPYVTDDGEEVFTSEKLGTLEGNTMSYSGYHTIDVSSLGMDAVKSGDIVAVVFDFGTPTNVFADSTGTAGGGRWNFFTDLDPYRGMCTTADGANAPVAAKTSLRIKMFTDSYSDGAPAVAFTSDFSSVDLSDTTARVSAVADNVTNVNDYYIRYECITNDYLSVDSVTGLITPKKVGGPVNITAKLYRYDTSNVVASDTKAFYITSALTALRLPETQTISLNEEKTLQLQYEPSTASVDGAVWSSNAPLVVTVDDTGKITGKSYGSADITCKVGNITSNVCKVTVGASYTGVTLDKETLTVRKGSTGMLIPSVLPEDNNDVVNYEWSSSDTSVAVVDGEGKVSAVDYGDATITVKIKGSNYSDTCKVSVIGKMTGVELNKDETAVIKGGATQLIAQALPEDTTDTVSFTWKSNDTSIATVDETGKVTGVNFGDATITVTCGTFTDTCIVHVTGEVAAINLDKTKVILAKGKSTKVSVSVEPEEVAGTPVITLESSDGNVATISDDGTITAIGDGTCTITASYNGLKDTCEVIVDSLKAMDGTTSVSSVSIRTGESKNLTAAWNIQPSDVIPVVKWVSKNTGIATVDANGTIKGIAKGMTTVTLSSLDGAFSKTVSVSVTESQGTSDPDEPGEGETVGLVVGNADAIKAMTVGDSITLSVSYTPETLSDAVITFSSSDTGVVSVTNSGKVMANAEGNATVTVKLVSSKGTAIKTFPVTVAKKEGSGEGGSEVPINPSNYKVSIYNTDDLKTFEVGDSKGIIFVLRDKNGEIVQGAEFDCMADGIYISMSDDNVLTAKKAGTGTLYVTAYVDGKEICKKSVYVSVQVGSDIRKPDEGNTGAEDGESEGTVSDNSTDSEPETEPTPSTPSEDAQPDGIIDTNIYVSRIKLSAEVKQIAYNGTLPIKASVSPLNATNQKLQWKCSNTKWATIDQNGVLKAKKGGAGRSVIVTCKATDGSGASASYYVTITKGAVRKIKITQAENRKTLNINKKMKLDAKLYFSGDKSDVIKKLKWTSSNPEWATVDNKGNVRAYPEGEGHTVTITAKAMDMSGKTGSYKIKIVKSVVTKIALKPENKREVYAGDKIALKATLKWTGREKDVDKRLTWSSSNDSYATVDEKGVVQTYKAGGGHTVTIYAKAASGVVGKFKVKILASKVTKITIEPVKAKTIKVGTKLKLNTDIKTSARKEDANTKLKWTTSDKKVAVVDKNGRVTAKKPGKVTITVTSTDGSNVKAKIKLKVIKK